MTLYVNLNRECFNSIKVYRKGKIEILRTRSTFLRSESESLR